MGKTYDAIDATLTELLERQPVFFVATAPLAGDGLVNLSPKGLDSFRVLDPHTVAYLDLTGSGVETIAHLRENGRIVLCFCAFDGPPKIVRLHGRGEVIDAGHPELDTLLTRFPALPGTRSVIRVHVTRISDSCGFAVPRMDFVESRQVLTQWAEVKGPEALAEYRATRNTHSIDGLPGVHVPGSK